MSGTGRLQDLLTASRHTVVFTGAGISTESGIPDFRSPGGIWSRRQPIYFEDFLSSEAKRREYWRLKFVVDRDIRKAKPNSGHLAVARLVRSGRASCVITQNVDGLHQVSGIAEEQVIELHGNTTYAACLDCGKRFELAPIRAAFERDQSLPVCDRCRGIVKTATISFGQAMPSEAMRRAEQASLACDLFLVVGSSLVVYPAASFPELAKRNGARLVILNRDPTPLDPIADLVLNAEIGPALSAVVGHEDDHNL
ncbi:MAG: SIR2 family NAD-dependent protein deacylase [Hyphomicrobiales bacterium]